MSFFKNKNPNESLYPGGKKHITDIIKNTGNPEYLLWRQPEEDFNNNSTLIVMPGEEAIFVNGGNIENVFSNGSYVLNTNNYPFISRLRNFFSGGISKFNCVIYFFKKSSSMEIYWGTDTPIQVRDPVFQIACDVQARGAYKIEIEDSAKFLTKLIGSNKHFATQPDLIKFFRSEFAMHIKSNIAKAIRNSGDELIGINAHQDVIAAELAKCVASIFQDYGISLQSFSIESIDVVDNENRQKLEDAISSKGVFGILGDNWDKQKQYELMKDITSNPASSSAMNSFMGMGAGLGMGFGVGGAFGNMAGGAFSPSQNGSGFANGSATENPLERLNSPNQVQQNSSPATSNNNASSENESIKTLKMLKTMLDEGLITEEAYTQKMNDILNNI